MNADFDHVMQIISQIDAEIDAIKADIERFEKAYGDTSPDDNLEGYRWLMSVHERLLKRQAGIRRMLGFVQLLFTQDKAHTREKLGDARFEALNARIPEWASRLLELETRLTERGYDA